VIQTLLLLVATGLMQPGEPQTLETGLVAADCRCVLRDMPPTLLTMPIDGDPAVDQRDDEFVVAFWEHPFDPTTPTRSMGVISGNRTTQTWRMTQLAFDERADPTHVTEWWTGPITSIGQSNGMTLVNVGIAHDAFSTVVLDGDLREVGRVYGRGAVVLRTGVVLYQRGQPHAAPTHYVEVAAYDTRSRKEITLYPRKPYSAVRQQFISRTKAVYDRIGEDVCAKINHHCDPEKFNSYKEPIVANTAGDTVAFVVHYQADVFMAPASSGDADGASIMAVCEGLQNPSTALCRETPLSAWRHAFPRVADEDLPTFAVQAPRTVR